MMFDFASIPRENRPHHASLVLAVFADEPAEMQLQGNT